MTNEINAETLLNYLYPELQEEWVVHCRGNFYRNYNSDILEVDPKTHNVELARDGYLRYLPQEYISPENQGGHEETFRRRITLLTEAFVPIDTLLFRNSMKIEKTVAGLLENRTAFVLDRIFGIDLESIRNPLVYDAALLLPYVRESRGDVNWVMRMLEAITMRKVEMKVGRWSETDNTKAWLPYVHYNVVCDGLSQRDYLREMESLGELQAFVMEHWMPAEVVMKIDLITHKVGGDQVILNYSTELK